MGLDLLVLGSGVAGLSAAVRAAELHGLRVGVLTKGELSQATTRWAQGGVAAVLGGADPDSTDLHLADTLSAGAGLCDVDAVRVLVDEGPTRVNELIALGAMFDRDVEGRLELAREGGHSQARIVHAGGAATGAEVERALVDAVRQRAVAVHEGWFALDLLVEGGRCAGVVALDAEGRRAEVRSRHVLLATGGAGQLYAVTTNPAEATGDGVAMALRAGVAVADLEFVQFHPTALHHPAMPRPLLSEALRGHGALLRGDDGERFVDELLPRDKVSRAIVARMGEEGTDHVWLDATGLARFGERFPTIARELHAIGLDPARDWLPISPAAHYCCGGVVADLDGATALAGLWAAGEVACNGVMGANRLASNSLLDGMVFGPRVVEAVVGGRDGPEPTGAMRAVLLGEDVPDGAIGGRRVGPLPHFAPTAGGAADATRAAGPEAGARRADALGAAGAARASNGPGPVAPGSTSPRSVDGSTPSERAARHVLQERMFQDAGVLRSGRSLAGAAEALVELGATIEGDGVGAWELRNLITVGEALVQLAAAREESRGAHARTDFPDISDAFHVRLVIG